MRSLPVSLLTGFSLLIAACASTPPERASRDALLWEAAKECERTVKDIFVKDIDQFGRVWYEYGRAGGFSQEQFIKCYQERVRAKSQATPLLASGRVSLRSGSPAETSIPIELAENVMLIQVEVNGAPPAIFVLDTGASFTVLNPAYTRRFKVSVPLSAKKIDLAILGGGTISAPLVRIQSVKVGAFVVEDMDAAIHDVLPDFPEIAGLLGADFLKHFQFTVDRQARRLTLVMPSTSVSPGQAASPPLPYIGRSDVIYQLGGQYLDTGQPCPAGQAEVASGLPNTKACVPPAAYTAYQQQQSSSVTASPPAQETAGGTPASALVPVWETGHEWRFRWSSPRGSGTFTRRVIGEEMIGGVAYYVMRTGSREIFYSKDELAWLMERVEGVVEMQASPANRGFAWPLVVGKEWEERYQWENAAERSSEDRLRRYRVGALETVTVPAGSFQAFHVVATAPIVRLTHEYWYSPKVKWIVKEKRYLSFGVQEMELLEYTLAPTTKPWPSGEH